MSELSIRLFAPSLSRFTNFLMVLPNDTPPMMTEGNIHYLRPMKTLFLLHGYSGNCMDWMTGSRIGELAAKYNLAVVMPSGDNSFYLNMEASGNNYEDFICKDLIHFLRNTFGLAKVPEDTFIGGLSMGEFGALHSGLAHPEAFGRIIGLSSALICDGIKGMKPGANDLIANYAYYKQTFGDLEHLDESMNNPKYVVKTRLENGEKIQPVFMACGTEDFLLEPNRDFKDFFLEHGVDVTYRESHGVHDWNFWNEYIEPAICWALAS